MKFDPPMLTEGPLSGRVFVVTHGKVLPHPTIKGETLIESSVKYDVTDQFDALAAKRTATAGAAAMTGVREVIHNHCRRHAGWFTNRYCDECRDYMDRVAMAGLVETRESDESAPEGPS